MNLQTGYVTPQFHVTFDDGFTTVPFIDEQNAAPNWTDLFQYHTEHYDATEYEDIIAPEGDFTSDVDITTSNGDDHVVLTSIIAPVVQDRLTRQHLNALDDQTMLFPNDNVTSVLLPATDLFPKE